MKHRGSRARLSRSMADSRRAGRKISDHVKSVSMSPGFMNVPGAGPVRSSEAARSGADHSTPFRAPSGILPDQFHGELNLASITRAQNAPEVRVIQGGDWL